MESSDFNRGSRSMALHCLNGLEAVHAGFWSLCEFEQWLKAVVTQDPNYAGKANQLIEERKEKHE